MEKNVVHPPPYGGYGNVIQTEPGMVPPPTTTVVIQQPGGIQKPPTRDWSSGLCACCDDMASCCCGTFCGMCYICCLYTRYRESCCAACCLLPHANLVLRVHHRARQNIQGSLMDDCCLSCFCGPCVTCQLKRDMDFAEQTYGML